ncbi:MAG: acyl-CoA N-acyltransferase [Thermodesulfobacteriota bacterium]
MRGVDIVLVENKSDMKAFIDLPWKVYAGDSNWVPPLKAEVRKLLDTEEHPFWKFSRRALFLARKGSETVGRIAAIVDDNHNRFHDEKSGAWGFFECENDSDAAAALFRSAEGWLRSQGMTFMRGPLNPSTNYELGLLIEGFENLPVFGMTYNPPYYQTLVESCGLTKEKDLRALLVERLGLNSERMERLANRVMKQNRVSIRTFSKKNFISDLYLLREVYNDAWQDNWGFVPLTDDELTEIAANLRKIADFDLVFFIYLEEEPVGVALVLPDINPLLKRFNGRIGVLGLLKILLYRKEISGVRCALFGVKKKYQKLGIPLVVFDYMNRMGLQKKEYKYLELSWTLEDNAAINQFAEELGGKFYKRYRILGKAL